MILIILNLVLAVWSRETWKKQVSYNLCQSPIVISATRTLANSGFHKDLITSLDLGHFSSAFLIENTTSNFYMDLDEIREGLFLGYPPVFADSTINVEEAADSSSSHLVGVLCQTHHVTLPIHHRYQPASDKPYKSVCIPFPKVFVAVVTPEQPALQIETVEKERGCKLLVAPCNVNSNSDCGWEEVSVSESYEVCSSVPVGMLQDLSIVMLSTIVALSIVVTGILYNMYCRKKKAE